MFGHERALDDEDELYKVIEQASAECRKLVKNMVTARVLEIRVRLSARP